jgi:L-amino acid N-acyltransferase YncA
MTVIRPATDGDWEQIWPFLQAIVAAGETFMYPRDLAEEAARRAWMLAPPGEVLVLEDAEGRVQGSAQLKPNQSGPGAHVANASFMVAPGASGRGYGRRLGDAVLERARARGFRSMQFNAVVSTNAPAVHLWRSLGFDIVGTVPEAFDHPTKGLVDIHVMYRRL